MLERRNISRIKQHMVLITRPLTRSDSILCLLDINEKMILPSRFFRRTAAGGSLCILMFPLSRSLQFRIRRRRSALATKAIGIHCFPFRIVFRRFIAGTDYVQILKNVQKWIPPRFYFEKCAEVNPTFKKWQFLQIVDPVDKLDKNKSRFA